MNNQTEILKLITSLLPIIGISGIIGAYFQSTFKQQGKIKESEFEFKKSRYLCIIILMITLLKPEQGFSKLQLRRPDITTIEELVEELKTEAINITIYGSDEVVKSLTDFTHTPTSKSFVKTIKAMRKDLWGTKTNIDEVGLEKLV